MRVALEAIGARNLPDIHYIGSNASLLEDLRLNVKALDYHKFLDFKCDIIGESKVSMTNAISEDSSSSKPKRPKMAPAKESFDTSGGNKMHSSVPSYNLFSLPSL